jgi:hypothetical protein
MLLYYFIREDGQRNTSVAFLQAINSQLLDLLSLEGGVPWELQGLQAQFSQLRASVQATCSSDRPLLMLIDGLDEMAIETVTIADCLPADLSTHPQLSQCRLQPIGRAAWAVTTG